MPPAFVLSQDQTLRKIKLFYRKIRFKALKYLRLEINFVLLWIFKVYIALFNFQSAHSPAASDIDLIYHGFSTLQAAFEKFLNFFISAFFKNSWSFLWSISPAASSFSTRNRNIIYHRISFLQIIFGKILQIFAIFCKNLRFLGKIGAGHALW